MNHLSRKKKLYGAGKQPKVSPPVLLPPQIGDFQFASSFSYLETLDLISDGPIGGLVNNKGDILYQNELSRGVYLNGTPVSVPTIPDEEHESSAANDVSVSKSIQTFDNLDTDGLGGASINDTFTTSNNTLVDAQDDRLARIGIYMVKVRNLIKGGSHPLLDQGNRGLGFNAAYDSLLDIAQPPRDEFSDLSKFRLYTNQPTSLGSRFTFQDILDPDLQTNIPMFHEDRNDTYNLLFMNNATIANSDFFVCFTKLAEPWFKAKYKSQSINWGFLSSLNNIAIDKFSVNVGDRNAPNINNEGAAIIFDKILEAYNGFGPTSDGGKPSNPFMRKLIFHKLKRAFNFLNIGGNQLLTEDKITEGDITGNDLIYNLLDTIWRVGYLIVYLPDRNILNGMDEVTFNDPREVSLIPTELDGKFSQLYHQRDYVDLLIPICDKNGKLDSSADILGAAFIFIKKPLATRGESFRPLPGSRKESIFDIQEELSILKRVKKLTVAQIRKSNEQFKYNYNNVLIESRNGDELQTPFRYFNKIYIDKTINQSVFGPFKTFGEVQRISLERRVDGGILQSFPRNKLNLSLDDNDQDQIFGFNQGGSSNKPIQGSDGFPIGEGSNDRERLERNNYSSWAEHEGSYGLDEAESPSVYFVNNPNVSEVFVTLRVNSLFDTCEQTHSDDPQDRDFTAGDKLPGILNLEIEVGKVTPQGELQPTLTKKYRIAALVEGPTLIDIGNPDNTNRSNENKFISDGADLRSSADLATPFPLPRVNDYSKNNSYSSPEKRYVKVRKLSTETFSILISKELMLNKVTEIIPVNLSYPFSAIIGTKIDSKSFSAMPSRAFDARLKLIKIPSNYHPTVQFGRQKDKRYYNTNSEFLNASEEQKSIYKGDWNGELVMGWTDNPAWILYDLLTNTRYGLGRYIDIDDINKWELYKVGRFCDAVDSNGKFQGVPDGRGGLEPRYSCNILFSSNEKVFDSIQLISKLFRGQTFFRASEVSFVDERIKTPVATFSNNNVRDGAFNYSNLRRDQQFNTAEVSYLDRFENFTPKVEVIEDEEDIRSRGVFKKRIDGLGVTSRAMARRIGQHLIYKTIKENQRVVFSSGLEALLCQPGDLIIVDDDLKNEKSNFGKILSVDVANQYIQLSGPFSETSMTGILTVYKPTGEISISGLNTIAQTKRSRTDTFTITGVPLPAASAFNIYTGLYNFSRYTDGYTSPVIEELNKFSQYALYTGTGDNMLYFGTGYTGWTFATGLGEADREFVAQSTGIHNLSELNTGIVVTYSAGLSDKRGGSPVDISGFFSGDLNSIDTRGILESEIIQNSQPHISTFNVATGGVGDGFGFVSGVDNPEILPFIKLGSPYRFDLKDASNTLYKIDSIKEMNPNEYLVAAAKFDTGKFSLIENSISLDRKENTYDFNLATQIGDTIFKNLSTPENLSLSTGLGTRTNTFFISGDWSAVSDQNGYEAVLSRPNGGSFSVNVSNEKVKFDNLRSIGNYALSVKAIGSSIGTTKTADSEFSTVRTFILYQALEEFDRSFIKNITFS